MDNDRGKNAARNTTPEKGIQTLVFIKNKNNDSGKFTWLITAFQNTLSLPERQFPETLPAVKKN